MEDVYTIKVKTKPDRRNLYPSERRYSASTVSGLAWVHIALAATSFLLALLALIRPNNESQSNAPNSTVLTNDNFTIEENSATDGDGLYILVIAPTLLSIFALAAGFTSIVTSVRWYIDRNIAWLFVMSILSTLAALVSFIMVIVWFASTSEDMTEFYKDKVPFKDVFIVKNADVIDRNESHLFISLNNTDTEAESSHSFMKKVLSINILIAAFLELLWSLLSIKISYKGMRNNYKEDDTQRRGNCIAVVTTIKGNDTKNLGRNVKILPPKPDLIEHYPSRKIKKIYLAQSDNGFYLKNQNHKGKPNTETSSEFYKERMLNFLNRCASLDGVSNSDIAPSVQSETALNPIPEVVSVDINVPEIDKEGSKERDSVTPVSWGDTPDHTIYNQNNLNLERIFKMIPKTVDVDEKESDKIETNEENSEKCKV